MIIDLDFSEIRRLDPCDVVSGPMVKNRLPDRKQVVVHTMMSSSNVEERGNPS
jgi:hypothetical protein